MFYASFSINLITKGICFIPQSRVAPKVRLDNFVYFPIINKTFCRVLACYVQENISYNSDLFSIN